MEYFPLHLKRLSHDHYLIALNLAIYPLKPNNLGNLGNPKETWEILGKPRKFYGNLGNPTET